MAKKKLEDTVVRIKKSVEGKKATIGFSETTDALKHNELIEIFLASNCPADFEKDLNHLAGIAGVKITKLEQANDELGVLCKKPFSISVIGIKK